MCSSWTSAGVCTSGAGRPRMRSRRHGSQVKTGDRPGLPSLRQDLPLGGRLAGLPRRRHDALHGAMSERRTS